MNTIDYIFNNSCISDNVDCDFECNDRFLCNIHLILPDEILEITDQMSEFEQATVNTIILITRRFIIDRIITGRDRVKKYE